MKTSSQPPVTLEISSSDGIAASIAQIVGAGQVKAGELLTVDRWVVPQTAALRVYIPKPAARDALLKTAAEIGKLRGDSSIEWLDDSTADRPTHVLSWTGSSWILEQNPAAAAAQDLGPNPSADAVKRLLPPKAKFLFLLPPTPELLASVKLGEADSAMVATKAPGKNQSLPAGAHYWFAGRWTGSDVEYAWVMPDATEASVREMAGQTRKPVAGYLPLPIRSDWVKLGATDAEVQGAGASLTEKAIRLARVRAWLTLESPPSANSFPIVWRSRTWPQARCANAGDLRDGEKFKLYLQANPDAVKNPQGLEVRWVYVFVIDHFGKGSLIFPAPGHGNEANHLPYAQVGDRPKFDALIPLSGEKAEYDFSISEPFGVDSYFLLTSREPLDNPSVLDFDGLRTRGGSRGAGSPLMSLLSDMSEGSRGATRAQVPGTWSIERVSFRSVPNSPQ